MQQNRQMNVPLISLYSLSITLNNGTQVGLEKFKGKKILLVNTASDCGYTAQYAELQKLYLRSKETLEIIGFPANDFKEQEKGSDEEIVNFCLENFGVSFLLAKKSSVVKGLAQNKIFDWLSDKTKNGCKTNDTGIFCLANLYQQLAHATGAGMNQYRLFGPYFVAIICKILGC